MGRQILKLQCLYELQTVVDRWSLTYERQFLTKDLGKYNPAMLEQFTKRIGWMQFTEELVDVKKHLIREFYAITMHIVKGTKVTKVRKLNVKFDQRTLNAYLRLEDVQPKYLAKSAEKEEVYPQLAEILAPWPIPPQIGAGVPIFRKTLRIEAKGWQNFVCTRLDPCLNKNNLP